mgnify:FL=1
MNEGLGELKCRRRFVHGGDPCAERAAAVGNYAAEGGEYPERDSF